jgi:hypothetical protein
LDADVGELGAALDLGEGDAGLEAEAIGVEAHLEDEGASDDAGVEGDEVFGEDGGEHRDGEAWEVVGRAARQGIAPEGGADPYIMIGVGQGVADNIGVCVAREVHGLVEVARVVVVDGDEGEVEPVFEGGVIEVGVLGPGRNLCAHVGGVEGVEGLGL